VIELTPLLKESKGKHDRRSKPPCADEFRRATPTVAPLAQHRARIRGDAHTALKDGSSGLFIQDPFQAARLLWFVLAKHVKSRFFLSCRTIPSIKVLCCSLHAITFGFCLDENVANVAQHPAAFRGPRLARARDYNSWLQSSSAGCAVDSKAASNPHSLGGQKRAVSR